MAKRKKGIPGVYPMFMFIPTQKRAKKEEAKQSPKVQALKSAREILDKLSTINSARDAAVNGNWARVREMAASKIVPPEVAQEAKMLLEAQALKEKRAIISKEGKAVIEKEFSEAYQAGDVKRLALISNKLTALGDHQAAKKVITMMRKLRGEAKKQTVERLNLDMLSAYDARDVKALRKISLAARNISPELAETADALAADTEAAEKPVTREQRAAEMLMTGKVGAQAKPSAAAERISKHVEAAQLKRRIDERIQVMEVVEEAAEKLGMTPVQAGLQAQPPLVQKLVKDRLAKVEADVNRELLRSGALQDFIQGKMSQKKLAEKAGEIISKVVAK